MRTPADLIKELEQQGEETVKSEFLNGKYRHTETYDLVRNWLASKESERASERADKSLSISRRALRTSEWAFAIATIAMLLGIAVPIIIAWFQRK
jgi:hypothetical protein